MKHFVWLSLLMVSCIFSDSVKRGEYISGGVAISTEGWSNDNTYFVTAVGFPRRDSTESIKRRYSSKEAAIMSAQKTIIEKFKGTRLKSSATAKNGELVESVIQKELGGVIAGGSITSEKYDERDNCQIIYEVSAPDLKRRVMFGFSE